MRYTETTSICIPNSYHTIINTIPYQHHNNIRCYELIAILGVFLKLVIQTFGFTQFTKLLKPFLKLNYIKLLIHISTEDK